MTAPPSEVKNDFMERQFFSPDSAIWKIDREMALLLGGGRALLMQLAHPKVASGVVDHSHFREDPMGRLHRTMDTMWSIVFDEVDQAQAALQRVTETHDRVHGTVKGWSGSRGEAYDARDPDLLLWVHATLVDSALVTYDRFVQPLTMRDKVRYYEDTEKLALLFEVPESRIPPSFEDFCVYMQKMIDSDALAVIPPARQLAEEILYPRPWLIRFAGPLFAFITAGMLPPKLREAYGLPWNESKEKWLNRIASTTRKLLPLAPPVVRIVPHARTAQKRLSRKQP